VAGVTHTDPVGAEHGARRLTSPTDVSDALRAQRYVSDRPLSTAVFLAMTLGLPLLLEGEPGVGKTEVARALATVTGRRLIRLQCYEGIDAAAALYEWDYPRQLLAVRRDDSAGDDDIFSSRFLLERPLLEAVRAGDQAVLLIDEVDRSDDAFEAFLLEFLSDFQITIPEMGTVRAAQPPAVILTSNRTRDLHDALRRRCLYHWIDYPTVEREAEILDLRAPGLPRQLVRDTATVVAKLRTMELFKAPGISETIAWARSLAALGYARLDPRAVTDTLGAVIKDRDDLVRLASHLDDLTVGLDEVADNDDSEDAKETA
jgi:MoxR-like ATPase